MVYHVIGNDESSVQFWVGAPVVCILFVYYNIDYGDNTKDFLAVYLRCLKVDSTIGNCRVNHLNL